MFISGLPIPIPFNFICAHSFHSRAKSESGISPAASRAGVHREGGHEDGERFRPHRFHY